MAARLAGPVASPVDSTPLFSSSGTVAAPALIGVDAVFARMIATLAEAKPQPKTNAQPLPKITALPAAKQAPVADQTQSTAHPSESPAAPPSQRPLKALRSAGSDGARTGQASDAPPQDPNQSAGHVSDAVSPQIPASLPASIQPVAGGPVDNDPHGTAVASAAAPSRGGAEPPAPATTQPTAAVATTASETRSTTPFALPNSIPAAAPQDSPSSPPIAATAAAISAMPATPSAIAVTAPPVSRTTPSHPPQPASAPAAQIAPALISVAQSAGGTQRLTIRLDPPELGTVQIRVEHAANAPMQVEINVQRPETLTLLMRDQPHLQHALDQAGVPAEGRTLSFQLDLQDQRGTTGDHGSGHGRRPPTPAAQQMQADPDDPDDATAGTMRWSRVALDITA